MGLIAAPPPVPAAAPPPRRRHHRHRHRRRAPFLPVQLMVDSIVLAAIDAVEDQGRAGATRKTVRDVLTAGFSRAHALGSRSRKCTGPCRLPRCRRSAQRSEGRRPLA